MGKLQEFDVVFDHPLGVFHAGEVLKGALIMTLSEPMKMRNLRIWFSGRARVYWNVHKGSGNTRHTVHYRSEEVYIEQTNILFGSLEGDGELHPAGTHQFPFEVPLPIELPSSFEGEYGYVRYCCKATIDKPWKFDHEVKTAFTVLSRLDLNDEPEELRRAMQGEDNSDVSCCCWAGGTVSASFRINKRGFVPGEPISVWAEVKNKSNTKVNNTRVAIKQYTEFLGHSDSVFSGNEMKSRTEKDLVGEAQRGEIAPGQTDVWDNVALVIPPIPPSRLVGCNIINCTYVVKFYAGLNYADDIKIASEIIIGTIPLKATWTNIPTQVTPGEDSEEEAGEAGALPNKDLPPPPSYEVYTGRKKVKITEEGESEYTRGRLEYAPHYPFYRQLSIPEGEMFKV